MLIITRKFIEEVHNAFDELNYRVTSNWAFSEFKKATINTLIHCKDLEDAINTIRLYLMCSLNWKDIIKIFSTKLNVFNQYMYEGNSLISTVSTEDSYGRFYITNCFSKTAVTILSSSLEEIIEINNYSDKFTTADSDYILKYAKMSEGKMKLFDQNKNCLCNIVLSVDDEIFLENNFTKFEIIPYDGFVGIYSKEYIDHLEDEDDIDSDKLLAVIEWDIIEENDDHAVAILSVFEDTEDVKLLPEDLEMFLYFAMATFLLYSNFSEYVKKVERKDKMTSFLSNILFLNSLKNK